MSTALLATTLALATPTLAPPPAQVEVTGRAATVSVSAAELRALAGPYDLSDGSRMQLSVRQRQLSAELGDASAVRLRAVGPGVFESADGRLRMAFQMHDNGSVAALARMFHDK